MGRFRVDLIKLFVFLGLIGLVNFETFSSPERPILTSTESGISRCETEGGLKLPSIIFQSIEICERT